MLIIRRSNCINTSYGMISLCKCAWYAGQEGTLFPPDRHTIEINKYMKRCVQLVISKNF